MNNIIPKGKGIILLSGGLDSLVSLDISKKETEIVYALNFDYGQKAFVEENKAAFEIANYYNVKLETIELAFLNKIANNALTNFDENDFNNFESVWIPNRNGLFLNIAASYCDKFDIDYIIFGANIEEAQKFPDNSDKFIAEADKFFMFSTLKHPQVLAPCKNMNKVQMVNYAKENNLPIKFIKSCYNSSLLTNKKHCGECMSCKLLYNAVMNSKYPELVEELF